MHARSTSVWQDRRFLMFWAGQTAAQLAAQISFLAIPLVATISLDATPLEMGVLTALGSAATLVLGLHVGVLVDRRPRRPLMIGADLGRALLVSMIPLAALFQVLSMPLLYVLAVLIGAMSLLFDVAYAAFLPSLLDRRQLVRGNAGMELSRTAAEISGPGIAGILVQWLSAPGAILINAGLYLGSAVAIWKLRVSEALSLTTGPRPRIVADIRAGLRIVWRTDLLRIVTGSRATIGFFNGMLETVFVLYVIRVLGVGPATLGLVFGVGGIGFLVGALLPERINRRFGLGRATGAAILIVGASDLLVPLAEIHRALVVPLLIAAQFCFGIGLTLFNVNTTSIRQATTPEALLGRVSATARFLSEGAVPLGALLGGLLGAWIGLRETLVLAALGEMVAAAWLWRSPAWTLDRLPDGSMVDVS